MSKYDSLSRYLAKQSSKLTLSFDAIEKILGFALPGSARRHPAWWSNGADSHVQANAWLGAGFETAEVDISGEKLSFVPRPEEEAPASPPETEPVVPEPGGPPSERADPPAGRHPAWGAMRGTFKIPPDLDLTEPADPEWGAVNDSDRQVKLYER
jgi:hypothetical protein